MKKTAICLPLLFLFIANIARAETFTKELYNFDENRCDTTQLEQIGQSFSNYYGVDVITTNCTKNHGQYTILSIFYHAPTPIETRLIPGVTTYNAGRFTSYQDCTNNIEIDRRRFVVNTGVDPWMIWCTKDLGINTRRQPSFITQYAFKPQPLDKTPYYESIIINKIQDDDATTRANLFNQFATLLANGHINYHSLQIKSGDDNLRSNIVVQYYARTMKDFKFTKDYKVSSIEKCEGLANAFRENSSNKLNNGKIAFCLPSRFRDEIDLFQIELNKRTHKTIELGSGYSKLEECQADEPTLIALARDKFAHRYITGSCSRFSVPGKAPFGFVASFDTTD